MIFLHPVAAMAQELLGRKGGEGAKVADQMRLIEVSTLAGLIWRWSDSLAFDAALRVGRASGQSLLEARIGLTFSLDLLGRT
jgi:hypothetical protein